MKPARSNSRQDSLIFHTISKTEQIQQKVVVSDGEMRRWSGNMKRRRK
jgi:hypothetical protein